MFPAPVDCQLVELLSGDAAMPLRVKQVTHDQSKSPVRTPG